MTPSARLTLFEGVLLSLDAGSGAASRAVATARQLLEGAERPVIALQAPRASSREITEVREKVRAEIDKLRGSGDLEETWSEAARTSAAAARRQRELMRGPTPEGAPRNGESFVAGGAPVTVKSVKGAFAKVSVGGKTYKAKTEHLMGLRSGQMSPEDFKGRSLALREADTSADNPENCRLPHEKMARRGKRICPNCKKPLKLEEGQLEEGLRDRLASRKRWAQWEKDHGSKIGGLAKTIDRMKVGDTHTLDGNYKVTIEKGDEHSFQNTGSGVKGAVRISGGKTGQQFFSADDYVDAAKLALQRANIGGAINDDPDDRGTPKEQAMLAAGKAAARGAPTRDSEGTPEQEGMLAFGKAEAHKYRLAEAADSLKKASTPEPFSASKTSNWVARAGGLPAYIQHIAHDLMEKRGKSESNAIQMAIGIVRNWASGKGNVDKNTRAAAAKAVAEFAKLRAKNAAKKAAKKLSEADLIEAELFERWDRYELTEAEVAEAAELEEAWSEAARAAALRARHAMGGPGRELGHLQDRADTEMTPAKPGERLPMPDGSSLELVGHLRNNKKLVKFHDGSFGAVNDWRNDPKWHATHPDWKPGAVAEAKVEEPTKDPKEKPKDAKGGDSGAPGQNVDPGGERVANLQRRLSSLGFDTKDDGHFGPKTAAAVKSFQRHSALVEDGIVGAKTIEALRRAPHPQDMEDADKDRLLKAGEPDDDGDETQDAEAPDGKKIPGAASERGKTTPAPKSAAKPASGRAGTGSAVHLYKGTGVGEKKGDEKVRSVQADLGHLGYEVHTDGRFGPETEKTVKRFQRKYGLKPDGIVGPKTHRAMAGVTKKKKRLMECVEARKAATGSDAARLLARERMLRVQVEEGYDAGQLEEMWSAASRAAALMARRRTKGVGDMHPDWMERRDGEFPGEGLAREGERAHGMTEIGQRAFGTVRGGHLVTDSGTRLRTVGAPEKVTDAAGHEALRRKQARLPIGHAQAVPRGV